MASKIGNNSFGLPSLLKEGTRHMQGPEEAINRNIAACLQTTSLTTSSYGPLGLSKLIVNGHGKLILTNNAGVILKEVNVEHPAARIVLMAAEQQKREHGDASGWVCAMIGEWLTQAESLLKMGLSASQIVDGYEIAGAKAEELLRGMESVGELADVVRTVLAAKQYGLESFIASLVTQAVDIVAPASSFNTDNVRIVKIMGGALEQSYTVGGMLFNRDSEGKVKSLSAAQGKRVKVAVFACPIGSGRTETKGTVLFNTADEMLAFNRSEEQAVEAQIRAVAAAGVQVVVSQDAISDVAIHFMDALGIMAVKCPSKFDIRRLCRALGATVMARLGQPLEEELGYAEAVETVEIGSDRCLLFKALPSVGSIATIVLRGSSPNHMDDIERAIDDAIASIKVVFKDSSNQDSGSRKGSGSRKVSVLPGAGATEVDLSRKLQAFASTCPGVVQYSIRKFAAAFDIIPATLAVNAGIDESACVARLHASGAGFGVNIEGSLSATLAPTAISADQQQSDYILKPKEAGIVDLYATKVGALKHALQAALTILRVDQIIMSKPAGGPAPPRPAMQDA